MKNQFLPGDIIRFNEGFIWDEYMIVIASNHSTITVFSSRNNQMLTLGQSGPTLLSNSSRIYRLDKISGQVYEINSR